MADFILITYTLEVGFLVALIFLCLTQFVIVILLKMDG